MFGSVGVGRLGSEGSRAIPSYPTEFPIFKFDTTLSVRCRCGVQVPRGGEIVGFTTVPQSLQSLFRGAVFCSPKCVRAFCLESLEIIESVDTPDSKAMVSDLHELYRGIAETLVLMIGE